VIRVGQHREMVGQIREIRQFTENRICCKS
jgi:hypothetical protein